MRRFIDVVFIHPKNRYYVVLHQGKFWQLARMNLSVSSWVFKLLYKGSLGDIFVARNQAVVDEKLSKILKTYELPAELHGLNANRFLDWWEMNDYKWLSTKDVITLETLPTVAPKPVEPPKTVITPAALAILQKKRLIDESSQIQNLQAQATPAPAPNTANFVAQSTPVQTPSPAPISPAQSQPQPSALAELEQEFATLTKIAKTDGANQTNAPLSNEPTLTQPPPTSQISTHGKTVVNDSLLGRFKLSPEADFTPNLSIKSPIPNPSPANQAPKLEPTAETHQTNQQAQEPISMPQPSRPMSKLHEFNAQFGKKPINPNPTERQIPPTMPQQTKTNGTNTPAVNRSSPQNGIGQNTLSHNNLTQNTITQSGMAQNTQHPVSKPLTQTLPSPSTPLNTATNTKPRTSALDESFDIFDDLLKELTDELIFN